MRSILAFVVVVALALGLYAFFNKDPEPLKQPGQNYPARTTERPQIGVPSAAETSKGEASKEARVEADVFTWRDTVSDKYLVPMEDAWDVDLSAVDLSRDLLCRVDGVDITRDDLLTWLCLRYGQGVINSKVYTEFGHMAAAETGRPYGLTDEQWEVYFNEWLGQNNVSKDMALMSAAIQMHVDPDEVEALRRGMVETVLAFFPPVETADELPLGFAAGLPSDGQRAQAASYGTLMQETIERLARDNGRIDAPIIGLVDPMSMLFTNFGADMRFRRTWSGLIHELPKGALMGIFKGEVDPNNPLPPWEAEGDLALVSIDDVWPAIEPGIKPELMRENLREVVWYKVLRAKLAASGDLPTAHDSWMQYAKDYMAHRVTFFNLDSVISQRGYPGRDFYLADQVITSGFMNAQQPDWQDEAHLRAFFEANGFFTMGWEPDLEIALFVAHDPKDGMDAVANWDRARSEAEAFKQRVDAGESFTTLRLEHNRELVDAYRELSESMGDSFAEEFGTGEFSASMNMINQVLRESVWRQHVEGVSPLRNAIVRLDEGQVSPPWKVPVGYVLVRMNGAKLSKLEREFEDVLPITRGEHAAWAFRVWVTDQLKALTVELPE